jgi:hypothetical protein
MKHDTLRLQFDLTGPLAERFVQTSSEDLRPLELHAIFLIRKALGLTPAAAPGAETRRSRRRPPGPAPREAAPR